MRCWSWIHAGKFHFAHNEAGDPTEQAALCASQKLSERMRCTLDDPLIHGLRIHSPDGSHGKWHETMLLKLTKCRMFTLKWKYFQATKLQLFACVLFQMQTQSNSNRRSFKYIKHYSMRRSNNTFQTTYRYLCLSKLQRKTQAYP